MENQLYNLLSKEPKINSYCLGKCQSIRSNLGMLRKTLNRRQQKLLLRIVDDSNYLLEKAAFDNFENGFRLATKLMFESLYKAYDD